MAAFPGAIPTFAGFTSTHTLAADNHAAQHNLEQAEVVAIATKVGTGASTPVVGSLLRATGLGTSGWGQADLTTDVTGVLPQANGGTGRTDATGSGAPVYQTSPTIVTPTIADLTNMQHDHGDASGGGMLDAALALIAGSLTYDILGKDSSWDPQTYVPVVTGSTTNPTLGASAIQLGKYVQLGKLVICEIDVTFGTSGTNAGSGSYFISLPVPADVSGGLTFGSLPVGIGRMVDASSGFSGMLFPEIETSSTLQLVYYTGIAGTAAASAVTNAAPWAWTTSDVIFRGTIIYFTTNEA